MTSESLGQYELLHRIAHGGMAEIFLAKRRGPGGFDKRVVIKRVLPHLSENQNFIQMFLDEARLVSRLNHPNIVQIFDFGSIGKTYYLCMEHLDGEDLATVLRVLRDRDEPLSPHLAAIILSAACDGMHYAHNMVSEDGAPLKIVHRDLSPSNVFLTSQGAVKVLDFGVATMEGKMVQTQSGVVKGKFAYLSPEQARGHDLDARSDVFALGLILHEALTGKKVFKRANEAATLHAVLNEPIAPPRKLRPDIPEEVSRVAMKALARSPEDRWRSAQEMRAALDDFLSTRGSVPAAAQLQAFMKSIVGEARSLESAPTPLGSQLGAVLPPGTGVDARFEAVTRGAPSDGLESTASTAIERTPSAQVPLPVGKPPRPATSPGSTIRNPNHRRGLSIFLTVILGAAVITGGWWMSQQGAEEPAPETEQGPSLATETAEAEADPEVTARPEPPTEDKAALEVARRTAAGHNFGQAVSRKGRKGRRGKKGRAGKTGKTTGKVLAVTPVKETPEAPKPPAPGKLDVNCNPFCRIYIDGKDTGKHSPARNIPLSAGEHLVKVVNPPTKLTREKKVVIQPGKTRQLTISF